MGTRDDWGWCAGKGLTGSERRQGFIRSRRFDCWQKKVIVRQEKQHVYTSKDVRTLTLLLIESPSMDRTWTSCWTITSFSHTVNREAWTETQGHTETCFFFYYLLMSVTLILKLMCVFSYFVDSGQCDWVSLYWWTSGRSVPVFLRLHRKTQEDDLQQQKQHKHMRRKPLFSITLTTLCQHQWDEKKFALR